jgi:hypothetical protein
MNLVPELAELSRRRPRRRDVCPGWRDAEEAGRKSELSASFEEVAAVDGATLRQS